MTLDPYTALRIAKNATQEEIKAAYREIARKFHPDKNPGDHAAERIFKEAAEAYRILGDAKKKAQFDLEEQAKKRGSDAADIFQEIFGRRPGARRRPKERGSDLKYNLELEFEEAALGIEKNIEITSMQRCTTCAGTGARSGTAPTICRSCKGTGEQAAGQGFFSAREKCADCAGTGKKITAPCADCSGQGRRKTTRTLSVTVPEGVDQGTRLKLAKEGEPGREGGDAGDLFVVVNVAPHPFFTRDGDDVVLEMPIRFVDAALGATMEVPTIDGKVLMQVPPGSQSGRELRLKGKGIPRKSGGGRGDQRVRIHAEIPSQLSEEQRALLERYRVLEEEDISHPKVRDFARRVREWDED